MRPHAINALLGLALFSAWLGCFGFFRLRAALDRLHCVAFVAAAAGLPIVVAGFVADGASDRAFKILLLAFVQLASGAALAHALGRTLLLRPPAEEQRR